MVDDTMLVAPRLVTPCLSDGLPTNGEPVWVQFSPCGLLIELQTGGARILVDRFAWGGVVQAVVELDAELQQWAHEVNRVVLMLEPGE